MWRRYLFANPVTYTCILSVLVSVKYISTVCHYMHTVYEHKYYTIGPAVGCQGNPDPYLIFITINNISRVNIDGSGNETIVTGLSNGVAIDYDYYNDRMYWTDVSLGHIKTAPLSTGCPITTLVSGKQLLHTYCSPIHGMSKCVNSGFN